MVLRKNKWQIRQVSSHERCFCTSCKTKTKLLSLGGITLVLWILIGCRYRFETLSFDSDGMILKESFSRNVVLLKNPQAEIVSKSITKLSHYLQDDNKQSSEINNFTATISLAEASKGREQILTLLRDAGIQDMQASDVLKLPTWEQVQDLYGPEPVIWGLDHCSDFQEQVAPEDRFIGIAGNFNSGTTAFGLSLQANCRLPQRPDHLDNSFNTTRNDPYSNGVVSNVNGMLNQVPWAKHKMAYFKHNHTIIDTIPKSHVLPVVLVRDPYYWMQSMCKEGYGVRWDHDPEKHCPNLIPNEFDKQRFHKRLEKQWQYHYQSTNITDGTTLTQSIRVWMGANPQVGPSWDSLAHYWNAWYESYFFSMNHGDDKGWPRLIIRFEDTLFHPKQVMEQVCQCSGGQLVRPFRYLLDKAKWDHKQQQNNWITAMIRYGTEQGRFRNMTIDDMHFARKTLNPELMRAFKYRY